MNSILNKKSILQETGHLHQLGNRLYYNLVVVVNYGMAYQKHLIKSDNDYSHSHHHH